MKKVISIFILGAIILSLPSCKGESANNNSMPESTNFNASSQPTEGFVLQETVAETKTSMSSEASVQKNSTETSSSVAAGSIEEINTVIENDISNTVAILTSEYEQLETEINTYDMYIQNTNKVETFYNMINDENKDLCIRMQEYAVIYAEKILSSNISIDDKYDEFDELYDNIYDEGGDNIYNEIYDGLLDDMYDLFYDGVLDDGYDEAPYKEWSKASSQEYDWWSETSSDVYDQWSDFQSDVYDFWSDIRDELWNNNVDKAEEVLSDYKDDVAKLRAK